MPQARACARSDADVAETQHAGRQAGVRFEDLLDATRMNATAGRAGLRAKAARCSQAQLVPRGARPRDAHVGKSLYVHQLAAWLGEIPRRQVYVLVLERFQRAPLQERGGSSS